ncbi:CRISPR system precrRNA processing endoribonuclease RAMP protein Cas6 [bacterium]|nr:CRISPR system precrRNA processing endoribonuclease RAMP protein Cas6 [bacterium]
MSRFSIRFHTPARIQSGEGIVRHPSLFDIISSLGRRLYLLQHFHQPGSALLGRDSFLDAAREGITISQDLHWVDGERHSTRQNRAIPIGGIVGTLGFRADIGILRPVLLAGQHIHIGKDTSLGMGNFQLIEEEQL